MNRALFTLLVIRLAPRECVRLLVLAETFLLTLSIANFTGFFLSYGICILYIFTSLLPSHNHPIGEAGHCWQIRGWRPEGLATLLTA